MTNQDDSTQTNPEHAAVPPGFAPLRRGGPYAAALGPLYLRQESGNTTIALRVEERHANTRGIAHGGMLASLADCALGIGLTLACEDRQSFVTASLNTDFLDAAHPGDWVEAHVEIQRIGRRLAFANAWLQVGDKRVLRASGVFATMPPFTPEQLAAG